MGSTRFFMMGGGSSPEELLDRAGAHGEIVRAAAHRTPVGSGCYGAVEVLAKDSNANPGDRRLGREPAPAAAGGEEGAGVPVGAGPADSQAHPAPAPDEPPARIFDLMDALKKALAKRGAP